MTIFCCLCFGLVLVVVARVCCCFGLILSSFGHVFHRYQDRTSIASMKDLTITSIYNGCDKGLTMPDHHNDPKIGGLAKA